MTVTVRRGDAVVKRFRARSFAAGRTNRLRFAQKGRPRGDYRVTIRAGGATGRQTRTLTSRKL